MTSPLSPNLEQLPENDSQWEYLLEMLPGYSPFADPVIPGMGECYFDPDEAHRVISIFHQVFVHIEGALAGKPFLLQRWQQSQIANLFGWKRPDGYRRFARCLDYEARKNGKTPKSAGVALVLCCFDGEQGADVQLAASAGKQAAKLFRHVRGMAEADEELDALVEFADNMQERKLRYDNTGSFIQVLNAEASSEHGGNPHGVIFDELHAMPNHELFNTLSTSMASENRKQSLFLAITTADYDRESPCNDMYDYACKVRDGVIQDATFLPVIFDNPPTADYRKRETWVRANPNLGVSVSERFLEREAKRAEIEPGFREEFRRLHCNIKTGHAHEWIDLTVWDDNVGATYTDDDLYGYPCHIGVDLSSTTDMTAVVAVWALPDAYVWRPTFFLPAAMMDHVRKDKAPYGAWVEDGLIRVTEGRAVDYGTVEREIVDIATRFNATEVDMDPYNAGSVISRLENEHGIEVVTIAQSFLGIGPACKALKKLVLENKIAHGGHPVLRWNVTGAHVVTDGPENEKIIKSKSTSRVDGLIAGIMATHRLVETNAVGGAYEDRDLLYLEA